MSIEDLLIKKIEGGIRGIKFGTKTPKTAEIGVHLNRLKALNEGMHEDLMTKYKAVVDEYNKKNKTTDESK